MLKRIIISNDSFLEYRDTPWDEKIFGINTMEILKIVYQKESHINILIQLFKENYGEKESLFYYRTFSNDKLVHKCLIENGFYNTETSLLLNQPKVQKTDFEKISKVHLLLENKIVDNNEINIIKEIAKNSFDYSRFHEDPFLEESLCRQRYINWIDDLILQNKKILLYKNDNKEIISFMFYTLNENKACLILGGSRRENGLLTPAFFTSVMNNLKNQGVKKVEVTISASNIVIFNIYITLGFIIKNTMFDFHKFNK